MDIKKYFLTPRDPTQCRYEAFRLHFVEGITLKKASEEFGISYSYLLAEKKRISILIKNRIDPFFNEKKSGPKSRHKGDALKEKIFSLRSKNYSIIDIKSTLEALGHKISHQTINEIIKAEGFPKLPRRTFDEKSHLTLPKKIQAPRTSTLILTEEKFSTGRAGGILTFLPIIEKLGIIPAIQAAGFPDTSEISGVSYVLSFLALKLVGNKRLSHDENWSLDRVLGLFAGLNVLPKNSSLSSYSYRVSRESNRKLLVELNKIFTTTDPSMCEFNIDFKTIPHWGDESKLEKNYSTTRGKSVKSILALIVQNVTSNMITYTNAETTHGVEKDGVLEFVDFWKESTGVNPKILIFDSQVTIYENLRKLDDDQIKFITLRRRTTEMIEHANKISEDSWKDTEVDAAKKKNRKVKFYDEVIKIKKYGKPIRQIIVIDHSKEAIFMLTNDLSSSPAVIIRKYGRRWLVEQEIAEQIAFFHLNQLSSSIVVKVDFDLTLTLLAHNLYRVLATNIDRFENCTCETIHRKFIESRSFVEIKKDQVTVSITKRSHSPLLFELPWMKSNTTLTWHGFKINFKQSTTS